MPKMHMPPEWHPQNAVWFAWPANKTWWPGNYEKVSNRFAALVSKVSQFTKVKLICSESARPDALNRINQSCPLLSQIEFYDYETDDVWCRDFGPIFIQNGGQLEITDWDFNAWGAKFPNWEKDNNFSRHLATGEGINIHSTGVILEGGAIDVNGNGILLTTEEVLLNANRNKNFSKKDYEKLFEKYLGINKTIWLKNGLHNDDTDGHIDNLARFVNENTIVIAAEKDKNSPNYLNLKENLEILQRKNFNIVEIQLPDPLIFEGEMLPASYMNFLVTNELVLVPTFNQPANDQAALETYAGLFPNHNVQGFDCRDFLQEGGAIHCLSQQEPQV